MVAGIIVFAIIVLCILKGFKAGGLRTFWSIGCVVAAIVLATILNPTISGFLSNQVHLNKYIEENVMEYLDAKMEETLDDAGAEAQAEFINNLDLPSSWKKLLNKNNTQENYGKFLAQGFKEYVSNAIALISVDTLGFILTFVLVSIILKVISVTFGIVDHIPLLKEVNKLVGLGAGLIQGLLIVWLIMIVIAFVKNYAWGAELLKYVLANPFSAFFYRNNLLTTLFLSVF